MRSFTRSSKLGWAVIRSGAARACVIALLAAGSSNLSGAAPKEHGASKKEPPPQAAAALTKPMLAGLKARSIGPAVMGGRVSEIALDPKEPFTFYVALGTGGLMKTTDNGGSFSGIFEKEAVAAVGAVAVAPSDNKVVWVGTGEANDRNSSSWGDGVYLSKDSGATWENVGLKNSRTIPRIVVHPSDPLTAWVAVMGDLWVKSPDRGLFKTTDGGKSWRRVLRADSPYDDRVGCGEVALDPSNPNVLYAALYGRMRTPWSFRSGVDATDGKDLGGIYKSVDGGESWKRLGNGLPPRMQRIGLAVFAEDPRIVYAVVQSDEGGQGDLDGKSRSGGIFRSDDAGDSWRRVNALNPRPFYFSQIRVDPKDAKRIYVLGFMVHVSDDGGQTFREDHSAKIHPDCHALAIDPRTPARLILGTDGGPYQSFDRGKTWQHLNRMAAGEFYRINVDESAPYRICGGLQDNTNWVGPSRVYSKDGIRNEDWIQIGGGDGFYCLFDATDPDVVYAESQEGYLHRFNLRTAESKDLRPNPAEGYPAFRFHWNSPLVADPHEPGAFYLAGSRVFRLTERGEKWELVSPDLSARDPEKIASTGSGAENYGVVYTLAPSPIARGLLWAGTDDGKLWTTSDGGTNWIDRTKELPKEVAGQWISRIEASRHDAAVAYLVVDAHRAGDLAPRVYRTADGGKTWKSIASNLPTDGPAKVLREDLVQPDLLFVGTEFALFVSVDRGARWTALGGIPTVAVDDLRIHPRERDLVIATHGRSLFVLDDIEPLRRLSTDTLASAAVLFPPRPAFGRYQLPGWEPWAGSANYRGANPPEGALLTVWVREWTGEPVKLSIANEQGQPVANLTLPGSPGMNRTNWDLRPTKDVLTDFGGEGTSKLVRAGEYDVTLTYGKVTQKQKLRVEIAPGIETRR